MEIALNTTLITFLIGQMACIGGYANSRFSWKFLAVLQVVIITFCGFLWLGHAFSFQNMDALLLSHIMAVILAHWFLLFSFTGGVLVSIKERALKKHKLAGFLPPLNELEKQQFHFLSLSLGALICAVILGEWYLYVTHHAWLIWNTKIMLSLVLCVSVFVLLWMHRRLGTRGQQAAKIILLLYFSFGVILAISHV